MVMQYVDYVKNVKNVVREVKGQFNSVGEIFRPSNRIIRESLDCMECPEGLDKIIKIPASIWEDIRILRDQYLPNEFAMFLIMEQDPHGFIVTDYVLPKQKVTPSTVEILDIAPDCEFLAHLHSHGTFQAFFSGTDRNHFNYDAHIVIGASSISGVSNFFFGPSKDHQSVDGLSIECVVRTKTTCSRVIQRNSRIVIIEDEKETPIVQVDPTRKINC